MFDLIPLWRAARNDLFLDDYWQINLHLVHFTVSKKKTKGFQFVLLIKLVTIDILKKSDWIAKQKQWSEKYSTASLGFSTFLLFLLE